MNWVDLVIIGALILFTVNGYFKGFIRQVADFAVIIIAILASITFYGPLSGILSARFSIPASFGKVIAFFLIWILVQFLLNLIIYFVYPKIPELIRKSKVNRFMGALPGFLWGLIFIAIFLSLFVALPIENRYKTDVLNSKTGSTIISQTSGMEKSVAGIFGGAINDTLTFLTVKPNSGESVDLGFKTTDVRVDKAAEEEMLRLVNAEREKQGLKALVMDDKLREVARAHSKDMFAKGYFAHVNKEGKDPFERMKDAGIKFNVAGENLALAPNVNLAHEGLMNSPGHRANILTAEFGKVGIGCIDGGKYGKMFSQEFTD
jgi:uncharacterized protein YkwD